MNMEENQPRVNPADWASRRKHAVSRARELRMRRKEQEHDHTSSDSVMPSAAELQRQRRSRQLEETQRLLDGSHGDFDFSQPSGKSVANTDNNHTTDRNASLRLASGERVGSTEIRVGHGIPSRRHENDQHSVGGNDAHERQLKSHSIISQKNLGQIHERYQKPVDYSRLPTEMESRTKSSDSGTSLYDFEENDFRKPVYKSKNEDDGNMNYFQSRNEAADQRSVSKSTSSPAMINNNVSTLREKPLEGRGRGRGRRKGTLGSESSLGELSLSSKSISISSAMRVRDCSYGDSNSSVRERLQTASSRSSGLKQCMQSASHRSGSSHSHTPLPTKSRFYISECRITEQKEGECEKLAILRQRLVARREKRNLKVNGGKENKMIASRTRNARNENDQYSNDARRAEEIESNNSIHSISRSLQCLDVSDRQDNYSDIPSKNEKYHFTQEKAEVPTKDARHSDARMNLPQLGRQNAEDSTIADERHRSNGELNDGRKNDKAGYGMDDEQSVVDVETIQCDICKRSFRPQVYEKHVNICAKSLNKKRPVFDSAKARIKNNSNLNSDEQMQALKMNKKVEKDKKKGRGTRKSNKSSKWRKESTDFREAMKAARMYK